MKKDRPILLSRLLSRYLTLPLVCLWFLSMAVLTWAVGKDFYRQVDNGASQWISCFWEAEESTAPGKESCTLLYELGWGFHYLRADPLLPIVLPQTPDSYGSDDWIWGKWHLLYGLQAAFGFFDHTGKSLFQTGGQYLLFHYSTTPNGDTAGCAYIDVADLPDLAKTISTHPGGSFSVMWPELTCTGRLEGDRFYPERIISRTEARVVYYESDQPVEDAVTLYTTDTMWGYNYEPGPGFFWKGKYYDSPAQLLHTGEESRYNFFNSLIVAGSSNEEYVTQTVIHCSPALYALCRLWPVYLISGFAVVLCLVLLRKSLKKKLEEPLAVIDRAYEKNRTELSDFADSPIVELQRLASHFDTAQQERHQAVSEVQQLRTALDYARDAEENRRKMVSAIAHELKTPLAVIHSYAEGLQTGIAQNKQEQYLSVIQEEAELMDALVVQMLELSRLEAGKVQLEPEQFSLSGLAADIFEKLQPAAEARQLQLTLSMPQDIRVTADRLRIGQVITNLATNAIKYAEPEGTVLVRVYRRGLYAFFHVENSCPPLSEEALSQVWDSFYRADSARDRSGTGLGLAIVKSIITLHRGKCEVQNTKTGVEFSFQIPL